MSYKLAGGLNFRSRRRTKSAFREGDWSCLACGAHNFSKRLDCYKCHIDKGKGPAKRKAAADNDYESSSSDDDDDDDAVQATPSSFDTLLTSLSKQTQNNNLLEEFASQNSPAKSEVANVNSTQGDSDINNAVAKRQQAQGQKAVVKTMPATSPAISTAEVDTFADRFFNTPSEVVVYFEKHVPSQPTKKFNTKGPLYFQADNVASKSKQKAKTRTVLQLQMKCSGKAVDALEVPTLCSEQVTVEGGFLDPVTSFENSAYVLRADKDAILKAQKQPRASVKVAKRPKLQTPRAERSTKVSSPTRIRLPINISDRLASGRLWPTSVRTRLGMHIFQLLGSYVDVSLNGFAPAALASRAYNGALEERMKKAVDSACYNAIVLHLLNHALKSYDIVQRHNNRLAKDSAKLRARRKKERMRKIWTKAKEHVKASTTQQAKASKSADHDGNDSSSNTDENDSDSASEGGRNNDESDDGDSDGDDSEKDSDDSDGADSDENDSDDNDSDSQGKGEGEGDSDNDSDDVVERDFQDQGFTRAKILVIAPMRSDASRFVRSLMSFLPAGQVPTGIERFVADFEVDGADEVEDKPEWQEVFSGNADDDFLLGIAVRRKTLKLYAGLYNCDIIVASPLGLRRKIGAPVDKQRDYDFLSSVEVSYIDRSDVIIMQNWQHMGEIFDVTNVTPQASHNTDFSRIRLPILDGHSKLQRQTIISGAFEDAAVNQFLRQQCNNISGLVKIGASFDNTLKAGVLSRVALSMRQMFHRIAVRSGSPADVGDARFNFFRKQILPLLLGRGAQKRTLIFVASYYDFVRVRNLLHDTIPDDFAMCSEYSRPQDVSRNRSNFFHGRVATLITTERFYFYKRYRFRGAQHVVFYGAPKHPSFFCDMLNFLDTDGQQVQCTASLLFTQFDVFELQRIVGTKRASKMIRGAKDTFMFC